MVKNNLLYGGNNNFLRLGGYMKNNTNKYEDDKEIKKHLAVLARELPKPKKLKFNKSLKINECSLKIVVVKKMLQIILCLSLGFIIFPPFFWPVRGPVSSNFLFRFKPDSVILQIELHNGIDIAAPKGKVVFPTAIGIVQETGHSDVLGNYIKIVHMLGFESVYAHLDKITVIKGAIVIPGLSIIGKVGETGRATGPHLHFGIFINRTALPPKTLMTFHTLRLKIFGI